MAILLVDDDSGLRRALRRVLVSCGFEVEVAVGGSEALARLRTRAFDLVVLDVMMPDVDGIEVCERLRAQGDRSPVLMLTARMRSATGLSVSRPVPTITSSSRSRTPSSSRESARCSGGPALVPVPRRLRSRTSSSSC